MYNVFHAIGRLTKEPELRYTPSAVPVASFSIAIDRDFKNADGTRGTDFVDCVAWRKLAESVGKYAEKGRLVAVSGALQKRQYDASDGTRRTVVECQAREVKFLDSPKSKGSASTPPSASTGSADPLPDVLEEEAFPF